MKTENQTEQDSNVAAAAIASGVQDQPLSAKVKHVASEGHAIGGRAALNLVGSALWYLPGRFGIARLLGPRYSLRCVLFHDVSDTKSSFTKGLGGTITRKDFEATLRFITRHYTPVTLQDVVADSDGRSLPLRPVLVTFDDAYASVSDFAAPLCSKFGVPAVFFVNGMCLDNRQLALDNLVCHVANVYGMDIINAAAHVASGTKDVELHSMTEVFARFLPMISLSAREAFRVALLNLARITDAELAEEAGLYLSSRQLRDLATFNFEIGDHTYSHANCRSLSVGDFAGEIDKNKAVLEAASGKKVRSFSVPYGSSADLTADLTAHLRRSKYEAVFLSESRANSSCPDPFRLNRVSLRTGSHGELFSEIEILPRLRTMRNSVFAAENVGSRRNTSSLENLGQPSWPCASGGSTGNRRRSPKCTSQGIVDRKK
jgi:peptidoglycan/xylan/chitin deacetylase (PgdA/CDA1 family)